MTLPDVPLGMEDWADMIQASPLDGLLRVRFAAELIRQGHFDVAEEQLNRCLEVAPLRSRPRLLIVVLRERAKMAARRSQLVQADLQQDQSDLTNTNLSGS